MEILKTILEHEELLITLVIAVVVLLGKGAQLLALLDRADDVIDQLKKADDVFKEELASPNGRETIVGELAKATSLRKSQIVRAIEFDADGGVKLNGGKAALVIMQSGDFKKMTRKVGKFFKKIF